MDRQQEIRMLQYFWEEKEDLERYCRFNQIKYEFPEIERAWKDYKTSKKILDVLIENLN